MMLSYSVGNKIFEEGEEGYFCFLFFYHRIRARRGDEKPTPDIVSLFRKRKMRSINHTDKKDSSSRDASIQ